MNPKVNSVWIPPEGKEGKSMCDVCKQYRVYYGNERRCPQCGSREQVSEEQKGAGDYIKNEYEVNPMVATRKDKKEQRSPDFPPNAQIIEDREIER